MIAGPRRGAGTHVGVLAREVLSCHRPLWEFAFRDAVRGCRYVPRDPVQYVIRTAADGYIDIVKNDRVGHRPLGRIGEREVRLHAAPAGVFLRHDAAVFECGALHQQGREFESPPCGGALCERGLGPEQHEC